MSPIWIDKFIFSWAEMANYVGDKKIKGVNFPNSTFQAFFFFLFEKQLKPGTC